jgi:hypothetical protein
MDCAVYCQDLGVRNEGVRDYFVAMTRVFRCGDLALDMIAAERLAVAGAHVNAPGFGHLKRKGAGYAFDPA